MDVFWNKKDLERPANNTWIASRTAIDFKRFVSALDAIIKDMGCQDALHVEAAILSRLIYRMKSKFRSDKGLKNMEKVNRALLNYLELQLYKEYRDLRKYVEPDGLVVNLPTKQMLEYVLVRTKGFAKLMCRVENVSKCAAEFLKARISIGHSWTVSVIAYAVISRIWILSRYLLKRCCSWYNSISEYVDQFRPIGPLWLPPNYNLPINLKTWLDLPWIDQVSDSVPLKDDGKETIFGLIKALSDNPCELIIEDDDIDVVEITPTLDKSTGIIAEAQNEKSVPKPQFVFVADDIGKSIDRKAFDMQLATKVSNCPKITLKEENPRIKDEKLSTVENRVVKRKRKKVKTLLVEDISALVPVKQNEKVSKSETKNTKETDASELESLVTPEKPNISKLKKGKQKSKSQGDVAPPDIKTRDDLSEFLKRDSYPGLDGLQWNMLRNSIQKLYVKLKKCAPINVKTQAVLIKKANRTIKKWNQ